MRASWAAWRPTPRARPNAHSTNASCSASTAQFLVSLAVGLVLLRLTRYMSLAVLTGVTLVMLWILVMVNAGELSEIYNAYALLGALLIYLRFLGNIRRLLSGTERRVGESA